MIAGSLLPVMVSSPRTKREHTVKSWFRSTALAVISAVTLTGAPAIANAAPSNDFSSVQQTLKDKKQELKDKLQASKKDKKDPKDALKGLKDKDHKDAIKGKKAALDDKLQSLKDKKPAKLALADEKQAPKDALKDKQQELKDSLDHVAKTIDGAKVSKDGKAVTLKNGFFKINKDGNKLEIVDSEGKAVIAIPLKVISGKSVYSLNASLSNSDKTIDLKKGKLLGKANPKQLAGLDKIKKNTAAWIRLNGDYASYAVEHDTAHLILGAATGYLAGAIVGSLAAIVVSLPGKIMMFIPVAGPVLAFSYAMVADASLIAVYTFTMSTTAALISSKHAKDPVARKKAQRLVNGSKAYLTFGDVARA